MSMFTNPNYLNLARQFMSRPSQPGSQYAGQFPNMGGYSKTPTGSSLMMRVLDQMRRRGGNRGYRGIREAPTPDPMGPMPSAPTQRPPIGRVSVDFQKQQQGRPAALEGNR